jgi:hypothetical protein
LSVIFNLVLDYIIKKLDIRETLSTKMVQINAYVVDMDIISRNLKALEEALQELGKTVQAIGLILNQEKTKYMSKETHDQCQQIAIGGCRFERVS